MGLVLSYGIGTAATLTRPGLLVVLRDRLDRLRLAGHPGRAATRFAGATPLRTAALVLVVGIAVRGPAGGA